MDLEQYRLDQLWSKYLILLGIKVKELHPLQIKELKQAFVAGISSANHLFTTDLPMLDDEVAIEIVAKLQDDCKEFWSVESKKPAVTSGIKLIN